MLSLWQNTPMLKCSSSLARVRDGRSTEIISVPPQALARAELARATPCVVSHKARKRRPMRVIQCTTRVEMAAEDFWALRMDQNFDAYCARCDDTVKVPPSRATACCPSRLGPGLLHAFWTRASTA